MCFSRMPAAVVTFLDPDEVWWECLAMLPNEPRVQIGILARTGWTGRAGAAVPSATEPGPDGGRH